MATPKEIAAKAAQAAAAKAAAAKVSEETETSTPDTTTSQDDADDITEPETLILLEDEDILDVECISNEPIPYDVNSKMNGQFYRRYKYLTTVFICNLETFYEDITAGNVARIKLSKNEKGQLTLASKHSWKQINAIKRNKLINQMLTPESLKVSLTADILKDVADQS